VLVESASYGLNSVLRSFPLQRGDKVLVMDIAYGMVLKILDYLKETIGIEPVIITIPFPVSSPADFLVPVEAALREHGSQIKLASWDHISSIPTCVLPVKELIELCHEHSVPVLIDGAHVIGNIPLDIGELNPDFYASSTHKWIYSPKGSGFLYVAKQFQHVISPAVISLEYLPPPNSYQNNFQYTGTKNYNALLSIKAAIEFRQQIGDLEAMNYCKNIAWAAATLWRNMWNTRLIVPESMNSAIVMVLLPCPIETALRLEELMEVQFQTSVIVRMYQNLPWIRVSGQIYLEMSDFQLAGQRILQLCPPTKAVF